MIVDTSAIIAILAVEPESDTFIELLAAQSEPAMSAVTFHKSSVVIARKIGTPRAARRVEEFARELNVAILPTTLDDARGARDAYFRFGKSYHPAGLNLADCFAYALARSRGEPLLFKGDDFAKTDIVPAWRP